MSATGRNIEGNERHADDFYETPGWCTRAVLPRLARSNSGPVISSDAFCVYRRPFSVLDAGSGTGAILRAVAKFYGVGHTEQFPMIGVEKSEERVRRANEHEPYPDHELRFEQADFLSVRGLIDGDELSLCDRRGNQKFDLIISNPPYAEAEKFVEHALTIGTTCCFLLRLNWLASKKRAAFHRAHPSDVFVLPRRPSFTGGGTDATEYAWFVWGPTNVEECLNGGRRGNRWHLLDVPT